MTDALPVIPEPPRQKLERLRRSVLPLAVWTTLAAMSAVVLVDRVRYVQYTGLAHSLETQVSPTVTGRLHAMVVALNDRVSAGDVVALMDDAQVRAMIDTAHANLRRLRAEFTAATTSLAADSGQVVTDLLRLQMDEESRRLDALSLQATVAGDSVEIERLHQDALRVAALSKEGLVSDADRENATLAHEALRSRTERTRVLLVQTEAEWQAAKARREVYERRLPAGRSEQLLLAPLQEAITVEEVRLREVELQRDALVLRSPVAGQVSQVWCGAGQSLRPGDPILTIVASAVSSIIVYVDHAEVRRFAPRVPVLVTTRTLPRAAAESAVVSVGGSVQQLPQRLWPDPRVPAYGSAVVVAASPSLALSAGELVDVKLTRH